MNPLFTQQTQQNNNNANYIGDLLKMAKNPNSAVIGLLQNNPQIKNIINYCNGRNPKDVFFDECAKRGINPQEIINQLK